MSDGFNSESWMRHLEERARLKQQALVRALRTGRSICVYGQISPVQAAILGFPDRDTLTGCLMPDPRLFLFQSDGTL